MACKGNNCGKPKECTKPTCCGMCEERDNCPHGSPCPSCTGNSENNQTDDK